MKFDRYGQNYTDSKELCKLLYQNPDLDISKFCLEDPDEYNNSVDKLYAEIPKAKSYIQQTIPLDQFDNKMQSNWKMPDEYKNMDIAKWVLDQCREDYELQRVGEELLLYQERNLFDLLRYLKYMVDTMRENNVVWGVGRGSSVSSYVLFIIGVHKVDSIFYDLDIEEFLKPSE